MKKFLTDLFQCGVTHAFHTLWYCSPDTWRRNTFLGHRTNQLPMDLWLYQEMIFRERPACIVQTGIADGGSILYFAHLLDLIGAPPSALVIGVGIALRPEALTLPHPRIRLLEGNSVAPESLERVVRYCNGLSPLVVLSSDSQRDHVLRELELYSPLVPPGGRLIVENTNLNGHPVAIGHGPGPFEAVDAFLEVHTDFVRDDELWKRNLFSFHQYKPTGKLLLPLIRRSPLSAKPNSSRTPTQPIAATRPIWPRLLLPVFIPLFSFLVYLRGVPISIELPDLAFQTKFNLARWTEILADPELAKLPNRVETDRHGHILMTPPPGFMHSDRQSQMFALLLQLLPGGRPFSECPVSTADGVKAVDLAWLGRGRLELLERPLVLTRAPEICIEILSPSNTPSEIEEKRALYFDAGAAEVWICNLDGSMSFFSAVDHQESTSLLCPNFPQVIP